MDGLARTAGQLYREMQVDGKTYRLATPRLQDLADAEAELLASMPDPIEQAARASQHVPDGAQAAFWEAAFRAAQSGRKFNIRTDGDSLPISQQLVITAFITLRRHHADEIKSLADAQDWIERAGKEHDLNEIAALLEGASQETPPKKSPGPATE